MTEAQGRAARLLSSSLSPAEAASVLSRGTPEEIQTLVGNNSLTPDIMLWMIDNLSTDVVGGLLLNYELPVDLLLRLEERHKGGLSEGMIVNHPNAPIAYKLELRIGEMTGVQLERFFDAVRAAPEERTAVHRAIEREPRDTLERVWRAVRKY